MKDFHAWIFVSHSSKDLARVREVRNYLETRGTSPLLFHLVSLKNPHEFWPVIEREISERNFFLYCDSEAAQASEWVRKERSAVEAARKRRPIRIGRIQVDQQKLDLPPLDDFLSDINVFISYRRTDSQIVGEYCDVLARNGFLPLLDYDSVALNTGGNFEEAITTQMESAAAHGWLLAFLSADYVHHGWGDRPGSFIRSEFEKAAQYGRKLVPIVLDKAVMSGPLGLTIAGMDYFDATTDPKSAPLRLAQHLLVR